MGDDLTFAREFTRTAAEGLDLLTGMDDPRVPEAESVVTAMMTTIQRGAKRLRARHVYMAAQDVLSALHHETDEVLDNRIHALGTLVTGYARGLSELVSEQEQAALPQTVNDKWEAARATLDALLPKADAQNADMLSRLMRAPVTLADVQPNEVADISEVIAFPTEIEIEAVEGIIEPVSETFDIPAPLPAETRKSDAPQMPLDTLMRDVVADALSVARTAGRTISLSYDTGDATITEDLSEDLRARLGTALSQIIRQALPEGRVGHIDVNVAGEQMHIMAGTTALRVAIDPNAVTPPTKPLITPETEHGLRAQLAALMDNQDTFGTAS